MTLEELLNKIKSIQGEKKEEEKKEVIIEEEVIFPKDSSIYLELNNCTFKKDFSLKEINIDLLFINCKFEQKFIVKDSQIDTFGLRNSHVSTLLITHTEIKNLIISDNSEIGDLYIASLTSKNGLFIIDSSIVKDRFMTLNMKLKELIITRNSNIMSDMKLLNNNIISLIIQDSLFSKGAYISNGKFKSFTLSKCEFIETVYIKSNIETFTISGTNFRAPLDFDFVIQDDKQFMSNINKLIIKSGKFDESFILNGQGQVIDFLAIESSRQLQGSIYINDLKISKTQLLGENYSSNLVFNNCYFNNLSFDSFHNYSTISLISAKSFDKDARIVINNSNLGKTHFFNVLFNTFPNIEINHSTLTDIISANTHWFEDSQLNKSALSKKDYEQKREIYRQLKYALEKQGNIIASLWFKTMEMKMYKKQLFTGRTWFLRIFGVDRFILWANQSNSFGQNWVKPVLLLLSSSLFFQLLITIGVSPKLDYSFNLNLESLKLTWQEYCEYFNKFPQLLDPTQSLDKVFPSTSIKPSTHFWYFSAKIVNTFFGFQILTAFRKFVR